MADFGSYDDMSKAMGAYGYSAKWDPSAGKAVFVRPTNPAALNPDFEAKLNASRGLATTALQPKDNMKQRVSRSGGDWTDRTARWLDTSRNNYLNPLLSGIFAGAAGDTNAVQNGPSGLENFLGKAAGNLIVQPGDLKNKALGLATLAQPESRALRFGIPAATGAVTGGIEGYEKGGGSGAIKGALGGAAHGLGLGALGETGTVLGKLGEFKATNKLASQAQKIAKEYDNTVPGMEIQKWFSPRTSQAFKNVFERSKNWVMALRDGSVQKAAGGEYEAGLKDIMDQVDAHYQNEAQALRTQMQGKYGFDVIKTPSKEDLTKAGITISDADYDKAVAAAGKIKDLANTAKKAKKEVGQLMHYGRMAFDDQGNTKAGDAAYSAWQKAQDLKEHLGETLQPLGLGDRWNNIRHEYAIFRQMKDIADDPKSIQMPSGRVDLDHWMKAIAGQGRQELSSVQQRLGDVYDDVLGVMRRHADTSKGFDNPGFMSQLTGRTFGTHVGTHARLGAILDLLSGDLPLRETPVTNLPEAVPSGQKASTKVMRYLAESPTNAAYGAMTGQPAPEEDNAEVSGR